MGVRFERETEGSISEVYAPLTNSSMFLVLNLENNEGLRTNTGIDLLNIVRETHTPRVTRTSRWPNTRAAVRTVYGAVPRYYRALHKSLSHPVSPGSYL